MIRSELEGGIGVVTLDRPEQRNALTPEMLGGLADAVSQLGERCGCVLLRGEGRVFCAGFDLAACRAAPDGSAMRRLLRGLDAAVRAIRGCPVPVVAACRGAAIAGGCALVAAAEFAIADRDAKLGYPVVVLGVSPAVSAPTLGPRIGLGGARVRMLDPGLISGVEALRVGLVSDLVEFPGGVDDASRRLANHLAAKPRVGMKATKRWMNRVDGTEAMGADALGASLALAGGDEERELLDAYWGKRRTERANGAAPE